jgi:hypothetical protein
MTEVSNDADGIEKRIQGGLCSVEEMATLVGSSVAIDRLIAAQSGASTGILETLSQSSDSATREAVTGNPGTPRELLTSLAWDFPRALLLNPAFDLMIFEDPGFLSRLGETTISNILKQKECPVSIINWAYASYKKKELGAEVLKGIVKNPNTPIEMIKTVLRIKTSEEISCEEGPL